MVILPETVFDHRSFEALAAKKFSSKPVEGQVVLKKPGSIFSETSIWSANTLTACNSVPHPFGMNSSVCDLSEGPPTIINTVRFSALP